VLCLPPIPEPTGRPDVSRLGSWLRGATRLQVLLGALHYTASMRHVGVLVRVVAALIVVVAFVTVLAPLRPILAKPTLFGIGVAHLTDLIAEGCGPGWHWSNRRGWNWGRCILDRRPT
jgi:hypothetical protein